MKKQKIISLLDKTITFCFFGIAYFLPISKALLEVFVYLALTCFVFKKIIQRQFFYVRGFNWVVFSYLLLCFISIFLSSNFNTSMRTFLGKPLTNVVLFFMATEAFNEKRKIKTFVYILLLVCLLLGVDGIYQYFTHKDFIRQRPYVDIPRIYATFPSPNDFGCYLISIIPFVVAMFFCNFKKMFSRAVFFSLFVILFICLMLTVSRGSWFAFIATTLFMSIWIWPLGVFLFVIGIGIIALQQFYSPFLKTRFGNFFVFSDTSSQDRMIIWGSAWRMFQTNPWFGLGLGTFMFNFRRFLLTEYSHGVPYAHNCYLQMVSEIGIFGLLAFMSILILFFAYGIKAIAATKERKFSWYILIASSASVLGFCVQMIVDTNFYSLDLGILFWLMLSLGTAARQQLATGKS